MDTPKTYTATLSVVEKKRLQHESFAYGLPLHYSVSLLAA